jgi:hypothetical protein
MIKDFINKKLDAAKYGLLYKPLTKYERKTSGLLLGKALGSFIVGVLMLFLYWNNSILATLGALLVIIALWIFWKGFKKVE